MLPFPKQILIAAIFLFTATSLSAADYIAYHRNIIEAERKIFVEKKVSDGLQLYRRTFDAYDFVFVHDCLVAMQMALYSEDEESFLAFATKAFGNGLLPRHLLHMGYILKHPLYGLYRDSLVSLYRAERPAYLRRINQAALKDMYDIYANDQMEKNNRKRESVAAYYIRYAQDIKKTMNKLYALIERYRWPSDRLIGVEQNDIMKELKTGYLDMPEYYSRYKDLYNIRPGQFQLEELQFASRLFYPVIAHHLDVVGMLRYTDSFYLQQIALGNLHPKDLAAINDIEFIFILPDNVQLHTARNGRMFAVGATLPADFCEQKHKTLAEVNKARAAFYIAPIQQDRAKWNFMREHKMTFHWGEGSSRS